MWWFIGMCLVLALGGSLAAQNRNARVRLKAQHPNGVSEKDLSQKAQELLKAGQRLQALRQFRKDTGLGLKDAKEILDTLVV